MAGEIQLKHALSGKALYALVRNAVGKVWQTTSSTFVTYVTANIANYTIAMTEQGSASRFYVGDFPAAAAGGYGVAVMEQSGGSPAEADSAVGAGNIQWDGAAVVYSSGDTFARVGAAGAGLTAIPTVARVTLVDTATTVTNQLTAAAIATAVENQIMDDSDSRAVLQAIVDKINAADPSLAGLTLSAIAAAVRDVSNASPVGGSLGAVLNALQSDTDDIQSRLPAALTGAGNMKSDVLALNGSVGGAALLSLSAQTMYSGTVTGSPAATSFIDTATSAYTETDQFRGRIIIFHTADHIVKEATNITAYDPLTNTFTFSALSRAPTLGDAYVIV